MRRTATGVRRSAGSAAAVDGATTALHFLRDRAKLEAGQRVLIVGASGSIGAYAVQLTELAQHASVWGSGTHLK